MLGRIDIKRTIRIGKNHFLTVGNPPRQHIPELFQLIAVNSNSPLFHTIKHIAQRQLYVAIQGCHAIAFQLLVQHRPQLPQCLSAGNGVSILHGSSKVIRRQLGDRIVRLRRVQVIGGESCIEYARSSGNSKPIQPMEGALAVVENQLFVREDNALHRQLHGCKGAHAILPGNTETSVLHQVHSAFRDPLRDVIHSRKHFHSAILRWRFLCGTSQSVLINEPHKFQFLKQLIQLRAIIGLDDGVPGRKFHRSFRTNGCQVIGKVCLFSILFQLLPQLRTDGGIVQMGIYSVKTAKFRKQILCCFGANAPYAGNIVGGIPHQSFQIDEFLWLKTVFLPENLFRIQSRRGLPRLGDHQLHMNIFVNQL